ncbi:MAG TPA: amidohydrolase family protein [Segetibacter sp.]
MRSRKFQATNIFTGFKMLPANNVLVCDERGKIVDTVDERDAGGEVQKFEGIITPGFINCHCHLELSHLKGLIPENTGLIDFVFSVVGQRHVADEQIISAIETAELQMIRNGIVAVGDISNTLSTYEQKQQKNLHYFNFVEVSGWLPAVAEERFLRGKATLDAFSNLSSASIVPHAPYSVSNNLWQLIKPFYKNKIATIHNQETCFEDELFLENKGDFLRMFSMMKMDMSFFRPTGQSSLRSYINKFKEAAQLILVHNTFIKEADIDFAKMILAEKPVYYCLCVNANQYIEQALPPIDLLRKNNCRIVLGTDSLASNWSLSIMDEVKTICRNFPHIPLEEVLTWATTNGADALQMHHTLGSFETGKKPGVVLLRNIAEDGSVVAVQPERLL